MRPRHYLFLAAIVALAVFNGVRLYRAHHPAAPVAQPPVPRGTSPVWTQYDSAAAARDAAADTFQPALAALTAALDAAPPSPEHEALNSCRLWLLFYRQEVLHPDARTAWRAQTLAHTTSCAASHADIQ